MSCKQSLSRELVRELVMRLLLGWGARTGNKPTLYLCEAVYLYLINPGLIYGQWCKQMLPEIAAHCSSTPSSVETGLTRLIDDLWDGNSGAAEQLGLLEKPKVKPFIVSMGEVVRR